jgi:hypothetical protein
MQNKLILIGTLIVATAAYAKDPKPYQEGTLLRMDAVHCGQAEKDSTSIAGQLLGNDSGNKKSEEVLCQEYVLQSDTLIYRLRAKDEKHPALLPVGSNAQFRINKDKLLLRVDGSDGKEREFSVVSMAPRNTDQASGAPAAGSTHQ